MFVPENHDVQRYFGKFRNKKPFIVPFLAHDTEKDGPTGFQRILVDGGQGRGVYFRIAANAGLYLIGFGNLSADYQSQIDMSESNDGKHTWQETAAEITGNYTGIEVGKAIEAFIEDRQTENALRRILHLLLCIPK